MERTPSPSAGLCVRSLESHVRRSRHLCFPVLLAQPSHCNLTSAASVAAKPASLNPTACCYFGTTPGWSISHSRKQWFLRISNSLKPLRNSVKQSKRHFWDRGLCPHWFQRPTPSNDTLAFLSKKKRKKAPPLKPWKTTKTKKPFIMEIISKLLKTQAVTRFCYNAF